MKKKERERHQLERFSAIFPMFPVGNIVDGKDDGSETDFFVSESGRLLLGIELTELYRTSEPNKTPLQAEESIRRQIVEEARLIHERHGGPPLDVSVHFSMNQEWSKKKVRNLAAKLGALVFNYAPLEGENRWLQNRWDSPARFPYEIDSIDVRSYKSITKSDWSCPEAAFIPQFSPAEIQARIDEKNSRIPFYRQNGAEGLWLLIIHGLGLSSMFDDARYLLTRASFHATSRD